MTNFSLRPYQPTDEAFLFNSWLKSYRNSDFARALRNDIFYSMHHLVIERILQRPTTQVLIACDPTAPDVVYGYLVAERVGGPPIYHFLYVKAAFRRAGIAKALLEATGASSGLAFFTHATKDSLAIARAFPAVSLTLNPYLL